MERREQSAQAKSLSDMELLALAVELAGEDAVAQALLVSRSTLTKTWRHRGALPKPKRKLLAALVAGQSSDGTKSAQVTSPAPLTPDEVALMADATGYEAFRKLATIFKNRERYPKRWRAITQNLDAFADEDEGVAPARPRGTRTPPLKNAKARRTR